MPSRTGPALAAWLLLAAACAAQRPLPPAPAMPAAPWTLSYADGSANAYRFSQAAAGGAVAFVYEPITPAQSSTGFYSGGDPVQASLPGDDPRLEELWRRVRALAADPAEQAPERAKGTGAFDWAEPAGERRFLIRMGPALADFHAFVRAFR